MTPWYLFVVVLIVTAGGLAVDGGQSLKANQQAHAIARNAARAGADQLDTRAWRQGAGLGAVSQLDMQKAACGWVLDSIDDTTCRATVSAAGNVTVTTTTTQPTKLLHLIGISSVSSTAEETVRVVWGASRDESP